MSGFEDECWLKQPTQFTQLNLLGQARRIIVDKDTTTIVSDGQTLNDISIRCEQLRKQVNLADTEYEKEKLQDRIAKLSGGIAVIRVGAVTETEMKDKKLRQKMRLMQLGLQQKKALFQVEEPR